MVQLNFVLQRLAAFRAHHFSWYRWGAIPGVFLLIMTLACTLRHSSIGRVVGVVLPCLVDTVISAYQEQYYDSATGWFYRLGDVTPVRRAAMWSTLQVKIPVLVGGVLVSLTLALHLLLR